MIGVKLGLTPRNFKYRTWLYENAPDTQREIKPVDKSFECHECQQGGHKARDCPRKKTRYKDGGKEWTNDPQKTKWYDNQSH